MTFGQRVRELRQTKGLTLRDLAPKVGVGFTYISKIENGKLDFGEYPSEALIRKLAKVLGADLDEMLLLAQIVPDRIKRRVLERPDAFRRLAELKDRELDTVLSQVGAKGQVK
jgi:HTH-type transcriptional regulator, competence development regulator